MTTTERPKHKGSVILATTQYNVVGTRPIRHDGIEKVTGRAVYSADVRQPGALWAKVLRSPHAHARIKTIDTSRAEAFPGVKAVVTSADLRELEDKVQKAGESTVNLRYLSMNVLAREKALYRGHAVAAVAATDPDIAEEAIKLIRVDYEGLPAVVDVRAAMKSGAPLIHDTIFTDELGKKADKPSNVAQHFQHLKGDPDQGFAEADVVIEREFTTETVHQGYIEPHAATAIWNSDGNLTVWCSTQSAFDIRAELSEVLQHPVSKIRVIPTEIGGGFGGKFPVYLEPICAVLSRKTGKPVRSQMSRADEFQGTGPAPGSWARIKLGATRDGRLVAASADLVQEGGAFPGSSVGAAAMCVFAAYDIPHARIDGWDVVNNKPRTFAYRAPGAPQAAFAAESVVDELCQKLGVDPLAFRLQNAAKPGTRRPDGVVYPQIGCVEVQQAALDHEHYHAPLTGKNRGRGVATGWWMNAGLQSTVIVNVNPDGTCSLLEGSTDIGGSRTGIAMQAAEILGLRAEDMHPNVGDTDSIGFTHGTGGSRVTYATGYAAVAAARDVIAQMKARVAQIWEVDAEKVTYEDGVFAVAGETGAMTPNAPKTGKKELTFKELAAQLPATGGLITGRASTDAPETHGGAFATHIVDVEVDPDTGKVQVLRYTAVQDVGKAVHPSYVEGQIQGGVAQGVGWALNEEYVYNAKGVMTNPSYLDYRMPTALDLPTIDTVLVEVPSESHPFGVRGVGEVPIVPPLAAVANAIHHAVGIRPLSLPISPAKILAALDKIPADA